MIGSTAMIFHSFVYGQTTAAVARPWTGSSHGVPFYLSAYSYQIIMLDGRVAGMTKPSKPNPATTYKT